jgi:outer membrane immunogenic protein
MTPAVRLRGRPVEIRMSTRIACIAAVAFALCGSAEAGDLGLRSAFPAEPGQAPAFTWTGPYAGVQIGNSWGKDKTLEYLSADGSFTGLQYPFEMESVLGGVNGGYNVQVGVAVLGVEADLEALQAEGGFQNPGGLGVARSQWQASVRGRLGLAWGPTLLYATGGAAFAEMQYTYTNPLVSQSEGFRHVAIGYTVGGGIEYAFTDHLTLRAEYRYADFGSTRYVARTAFLGLTGEQRPRSDSVRVGVGYKF